MRTTLTLADDLLRQLKAKAARQGTTLGTLVNELLRHALAVQSLSRPYKLEMAGWEAQPQAGVDILDRDKLFHLMNSR